MFEVTLTKMGTLEENRAMSLAMNNDNLFLFGQCVTGKAALLRNNPKVNAYYLFRWAVDRSL